MIVTGLLLSILYLRGSSAPVEKAEESLLLTQIVHRHGDRTPTKPWGPNDPNGESSWPQGWGQLTTEGMKQLYYLGKTLRKRYRGFLSEAYVNSEVYVRSSGVERALMSAQSNMAGLFPPGADRQWSETLLWQPIPIHSYPVNEDWIMRSSKGPCTYEFKRLVDAYLEDSPQVRNFTEKNLRLIVNVTKEADLYEAPDNSLNNLRNAWRLGGNLHIARRYNKTLLPWMSDSVIDALWHLRAMKHGIQSWANLRIKKIQGGPFLGKILKNFLQFANGTLAPEDHSRTKDSTLKLLLYSGHDTNLAAILGALGLYQPPFMLEYGSALIFELHKKEAKASGGRRKRGDDAGGGSGPRFFSPDELIVKMFLLDGMEKESASLKKLTIPHCRGDDADDDGTDCRLSRLVEKYDDVAVWSRDELMQLCNAENRSRASPVLLSIALVVATAFKRILTSS